MKNPRTLTEGSISHGLLQLALPILCTNVVQALSGMLNSVWIGRYIGEASLTAVLNAQSLLSLLTGTALGIATAASIVVGQCVGADNLTEAKRFIGTGTTLFAAVSVATVITFLLLPEPLLVLMGTPPESLPSAVDYLQMLSLVMPSAYMSIFLTSILLGTGDSKTPLYSTLLFVVISLILTPVCIFGIGPFRGAGIAGSAFATFVAQTVSLTTLIVHLYRRQCPLCLHKEDLGMLRVDGRVLRTILCKGIPISAQLLVFLSSSVLMLMLVNRFGVDTTAAFGVSMQLWSYIQMPAVALSMAIGSMAALSVGRNQWDRIRAIARVGVIYSILLTGPIVVAFYTFDTYLYGLFLPHGSTSLPIASHINAIVVWSFVLVNVPLVLSGIVRAAGAVMVPLLISILSLLVVRFPFAAMLMEDWQADAIWWSFPISSAISVCLATLHYMYGKWRMGSRQPAAPKKLSHSSAEPFS